MLRIAVLVLIGAPMVLFTWEGAHNLLSGRFDQVHYAVAVPAAGALLVYVYAVGDMLRRWDPEEA